MKIVFIVFVLFFISLTLRAQEEAGIRYYLQDGSVIEHKLGDIDNLSFIKSDDPYVMVVYIYGTKAPYQLTEISSLFISNSTTLVLENSGSFQMLPINEIDSIVFMPATNFGLKLGVHTWSRKNLDIELYRNGDPIPQVTDSAEWVNLKTGAWCYYNNDPANGKIYGKLYNWWAINDSRGLAPEGWHIPTIYEWTALRDFLGNDAQSGGKLKTTGTKKAGDGLWAEPNVGATNVTHFSALPGGYRYNTFAQIDSSARFWSSYQFQPETARFWSMNYDNATINLGIALRESGLSIRCVEDYITPTITSVTPASAKINTIIVLYGTGFGDSYADGYVTFNDIQVPWEGYTSWNDTEIKVIVPQGAVSGKISVTVNGIKGNEVDFEVYENDPNSFVPVQIGDQGWMSRNLNTSHYRNGDTIPQVTDMEEWKNLTTGAWCYYNNDPKNESVYGKLYNWYAVNDPRGLAPEGWHVPREEEWTVLMDFLGGKTEAGGKMKQAGTSKEHTGLWKAPNWGATNESGFTALPAGNLEDYGFSGMETAAYWWSASEFDEDNAHSRMVYNMGPECQPFSNSKYNGYSVRCIKD